MRKTVLARRVLRGGVPLTCALVLASLLSCARPSAAPNVILVVMDTTRADRVSVNGYERPTTPRLAALAAEGVTFTNCWSPSSWTAPAHASLFTGLRPERHGLMTDKRPYLDPAAVTLAEQFAANGYATACFTNNPHLGRASLLDQGFQTLEALYRQEVVQDGYARDGSPSVPAEDLRHASAAETHELALAWAREQQRAGRPFFLMINDMEPHMRYEPAAEVGEAFRQPAHAEQASDDEAIDEKWARAFQFPECAGATLKAVDISPARRQRLSDLYDAEIATLDEGLGTLIDGLRHDGALDNTVVAVTSDHGENLGDHGLYGHMLWGLHASLLRVPLVIRFPSGFEPGRRVAEVVRLEDLYPTLLELCGLGAPPDVDGQSLLGDLDGRIAYAAVGDRAFMTGYLHAAFPETDLAATKLSFRSVFDGRHHLIRDSLGRTQLYDISTDPTERTDLSATDGAARDRMATLLERVYPR